MTVDRVRLTAEMVGIVALVASIAFVGYELKQTREMNVADTHHNRLSLFHNNMLAVLESESALAFHQKYVYTKENGVDWCPDGLTDIECAAGLVHTEARLATWALDYTFST